MLYVSMTSELMGSKNQLLGGRPMIKIQIRGIKYLFGILEYKKKRELIEPLTRLNRERGDRHVFIAHQIDENNYVISLFTSKETTAIKDKILKNLTCDSTFFKFLNSPVILSRNDLNSHFKIINSRRMLEQILDQDLRGLVRDAILNFKNSFNLLPNEEVIDVAHISRLGDKLLLAVKTKSNIMVADTNNVIYQNRYVDIALNLV
jgi:hypothetical protein